MFASNFAVPGFAALVLLTLTGCGERLRGVPAPAEGRSTVTIEFDEESAQEQEGDHQRE